MNQYCVYLMASKQNGVLYLGVTSNLRKRVYEHINSLIEGFTKQYRVKRLVWYETHASIEAAISREKRIKKWRRSWKIQLIEELNPAWLDLYGSIG